MYLTKRGLHVLYMREGVKQWKNEFVVEKILSHKGPVTVRMYLMLWQGYSPQEDSWIPRSNLFSFIMFRNFGNFGRKKVTKSTVVAVHRARKTKYIQEFDKLHKGRAISA